MPVPRQTGSSVPGVSAAIVGSGGQLASGRNSPAVEKKLGGGGENGILVGGQSSTANLHKLRKGYSNEALAQLATPGQGFVDSMTEGFSNVGPSVPFYQ